MAGYAFDYGFSDGWDAPSFTAFDATAGGARGTAYACAGLAAGRRNAGYYECHGAALGLRQTSYGLYAEASGARGAAQAIAAEASGRRNAGLWAAAAHACGRRGIALNIAAHASGRRSVERLYESEVRIYAGVDAAPDTDALIAAGTAPLATILDSATLPQSVDLSGILQAGTHTYHFDYRRFNRRGKYSQQNIERRRLDYTAGVLTETLFPPSKPEWLQAAPYGNMGVRVLAAYNYLLDGASAADTWLVWAEFNAPVPSLPAGYTYPMVKRGGFAMLAVDLGPFVDDYVTVQVATYQAGSGLWSGEEIADGYREVGDVLLRAGGPDEPTGRTAIPAEGVM